MKPRFPLLVVLALLLVIALAQGQGPALQNMFGTAFTYRGRLKQNGLAGTLSGGGFWAASGPNPYAYLPVILR